MLKKIFIAAGLIIALIALLIMIAGVVVYKKVDREFISSRRAQALSRRSRFPLMIFPWPWPSVRSA